MKKIIPVLIALVLHLNVFGIPKYNEGMVQLKGIQLLQDNEDENAYYYIPRFPRMAKRDNGLFEMMFIMYTGANGNQANGGLFHALIELSMPADELEQLQDTLRVVLNNNKAKIVGAVPLQEVKDGTQGTGSFQIVSSILNNTTGDNPFTRNVISSGHAPFQPGSKAAIAACLNEDGATLLWNSLTGQTSDISVSLSGYYEAYVKAYHASISAEVNTIYNHYSKLNSFQQDFTRDQLRKITDEMVQKQVLKIESFDASASLGVNVDNMKGLLDLITDKLIELMFDSKEGWTKKPEPEVAVAADQIKGRQDRGYFWQVFGDNEDIPYYTDNQYVVKKRKDIRTNTFYLNLSQATTIKVPVYTSGNLGGIYEALQKQGPSAVDPYFKIVNLETDPYGKRDISFMLDGEYAESFNDIFNFVTVSFRKKYPGNQQATTKDLLFTRSTIDKNSGTSPQVVTYRRLNITDEDEWLGYEYKVAWSLKGSPSVMQDPVGQGQWISASTSGVSLIPPLTRKKVTLEIDQSIFTDSAATAVSVRFLVMLRGRPIVQKSVIMRAKDSGNTKDVTLFHDPGQTVAYQLTLFTPQGEKKGAVKELSSDILWIQATELGQ